MRSFGSILICCLLFMSAGLVGAVPSIDLEKYVSVDGQLTWEDADIPYGPSVRVGNYVYFKFILTNDGDVPLTEVALSDPDYSTVGCSVPTDLGVAESFECIIGPISVVEGQNENTATATGKDGENSASDTDSAYYMGIGIDEYDWPRCIGGCTANDASIKYFLIEGVPETCSEGDSMVLDVYAYFRDKTTDRYCYTFTADVYLGYPPVYTKTFTVTYLEVPASTERLWIGSILWTCETPITLVNSYYNYKVSGHQYPCNGDCGDFDGAPQSKCGWPPDQSVVVPFPKIDVEKYVSVDEQVTWEDADDATGPGAFEGDNVYFKFVVTNTGNVELSGVTLTDSDYSTAICTVPDPLLPGESYECVIGPITSVLGQHTNTAHVYVTYESILYEDYDDANYYGCKRADAGDDKLVCVGDTVTLVGIPDPCMTCSTSGWEPDPSCSGEFNTPIGGDDNQAEYTPTDPGEASCKLYFNMTGTCCDSDYMTVYVIRNPDAKIAQVT